MRTLPGEGKFYRDSLDIRLEAEKLTGGSLSDFFRQLCKAGRIRWPYQKLLAPRRDLNSARTESVRATLGFCTLRGNPEAHGTVRRGLTRMVPPRKSGLAGLATKIVRWNNSDVPRRPGALDGGSRNPATFLRFAHPPRGKRKSPSKSISANCMKKFFQVAEMSNADETGPNGLRDGNPSRNDRAPSPAPQPVIGRG